MINENLIARIYTVDHRGYERVGTGYPIAPNLLMTASHVVSYPELDESKGVFVVWDEQGQQSDVQLDMDTLVYNGHKQQHEIDVAIIRCPTPLKEKVELLWNSPPHCTEFYCRGYPLAGLQRNKPRHDALKFSGNTEGGTPSTYLELTARTQPVSVENPALTDWKGLSGSPVIIDQKLAGVITSQYQTVERRLFAASLPYLLKHDDIFRQLVHPSQCIDDYKLARQKDLAEHLDSMSCSTLLCCEDLIQSFKQDQGACISNLTDQLSGSLSHLSDQQLQVLLGLLLTQLDIPECEQKADHTYSLKVGTQLLSEVAISMIYGAVPRFQSAEKGVSGLKGECVIPASLTETGFDSARQAEDQARAVSHAVYKKLHGDKELVNIHSNKAVTRYKGLNKHLLNTRNQGYIYRFELDQEDANDVQHPLMSEETRRYLKQALLPELLIAFYGEDYAFDEEPDLESQVGIYMQNLKR